MQVSPGVAVDTAGRSYRAYSPVASENGLVVTRATARRLGLSTVSDLRGVASGLTFTGTRECRTRALCLPGLRRVYGITFGRVLPLDTETQPAMGAR